MTPKPSLLLLAAGASTRMAGRDKLLEKVAGVPLIRERAQVALASGLSVLVALPPEADAPARWAALGGLAVNRVAVPEPQSGLSASLKAGIGALPAGTPGLVIMLADMPEVTTQDLATLCDGWDGDTIHRAAAPDGTPGNPVLFPARDLPALARLTGDRGARDLLRAHRARVRLVPLPDGHALTDLDTPGDWEHWRAKHRR